MRFLEIDFIKGIAVILMVIFHFFYLGENMGKLNINTRNGILHLIARLAHTTFIFMMGVNLAVFKEKTKKDKRNKFYFYKKIIKRCIKFALIAFGVSYLSYLEFGMEKFVKWGIFHYMTIGTLIASIFVDKLKLSLILILGILLLKNRYFFNLNPIIGMITGLNMQYGSLDYFPLVPWLAISLFGMIIGKLLYKNYKRNFKNNLKKYEKNNLVILINKIGINSIPIYIIHFLIFYIYFKYLI